MKKMSEMNPKIVNPNPCKTSGADAAITVADEKRCLEESTTGENLRNTYDPLNRLKMHPVQQ